MPNEVRIWTVHDEALLEVDRARLDLEERLERWLEQDISILSDDLLVIGRQVKTAYGGYIDLLCLDRSGDTVIVELKRDKTPREITAQTLDYASWVQELSHETVTSLANTYLGRRGTDLPQAFRARFGLELPEILNESHSMLILSSSIDPSSERIIRYLSSKHSVNINAVTFNYFRGQSTELLARVFLLEPATVEQRSRRSTESKRQPNLTPVELLEAAAHAGVSSLYNVLESQLTRILPRRTTRSSLVFYGRFGDSQKAVFSLIPLESSASAGLRFHLYSRRLANLLSIEQDTIESFLPEQHEPWEYYATPDNEASGFAGYFQNDMEVARFLPIFPGLRRPDA